MGSQGDNEQKVLGLGENEWVSSVHWSPDGQRLAYFRTQRSPDRQKSIETCDLNGVNQTVVVSEPDRWPRDFCWLADGRIVYSRPESPEPQSGQGLLSDDNLWQIGIDNHTGKPIGKPKRITHWAGSYLRGLSASADGKRLVLQKPTSQGQVYVGELAAGGTHMSPPRRLTNDEAYDMPSAWMPDSKAVLFGSNRNGTWGIFKQGVDQDTAEPVVTGRQLGGVPRLSADGSWILFGGETSQGPGIMRTPVSGGVPQVVFEVLDWLNFGCASAPASLCVIFRTSQDQKQLTVTAFDPLEGIGKVLRTVEQDPATDYGGRVLSPDGTTFAISRTGETETHILLLSLTGGSDREITVKGWPNIKAIDWSPDGKALYCGSVTPQGRTLFYVDLKGNARVLWQSKGAGYPIWGVPSPGGRYLAILGYVTNSNVWMVEGF